MIGDVCHSCGSPAVASLLDCGLQPVGHRFLSALTEDEYKHPLVVGQCGVCGLVQLTRPAPVEEIRPRFEWISYNEPDAHLDVLVEELAALPGITHDSHVGAVVFGGDKTLEKFVERGFSNTWRIDLRRDLEVDEPFSGTETLQDRLTPDSAVKIASREGLFDMLVIRHLVEHAHGVRRFLAGIRKLLKPGGYAVFEVPDCETAFDTCDYSILWEEHVFYFMPATFRHCLENAGFGVMDMQRPTYSLVALTRMTDAPSEKVSVQTLEFEKERMNRFATSLPTVKRTTREALNRKAGPVAFFGAGHMACTFLSLLELNDVVECVIDDHPMKRGRLMPGTHIPIEGSEALERRGIRTCLSALSPESETRVIGRNPAFTSSGGRFYSIFAGRPNSLLSES